MKFAEFERAWARKLEVKDLTPQDAYFHYRFRELPSTWTVYNRAGNFQGYVQEELRTVKLVSGQMYNPVTKIWSVLDERTGRIIDGLESKVKYEFIAELPSTDNLERDGR